ncbi:MAG: tRNA (N(6)-L-threonylcarbamoyladenosine(37)-C(2))-methylthiotransferase MtaB [Hyphomicrobiaceae bacterium]
MAARVISLGCRLNTFEAEVMTGTADKAGLDDAVIINTCAVTAEAVRQSAQTVRRARRENPDAKIVVTGCAAQIDPDRFAAMAEVDHVVGNGLKTSPALWQSLSDGLGERVLVDDMTSVQETAGHLIEGFGARQRAYVQVQNGCDHRCTFCIIPYGRGPSRSVPAGEVVRQTRKLVEGGHAEIVLTGVDITSWGHDLPGTPSLGRLIRQILTHVPELPRLRLSSIDSIEADDHLMQVLAEEERFMPHLHLSLQAGHDLTLKRMRRRHLTADARRFCEEARRLRPDVAFGADMIAGFPTETEEMFGSTMRHIEECGIAYLHVFPYSPRPGTPAARMPQVHPTIVKERAARLRQKGTECLMRHLDAQVGRTVQVLMERESLGRAADFSEVNFPEQAPQGLVKTRVTGHDGRRLTGELAA